MNEPRTTSAYRYGNKHKINILIDSDQLEDVEAIAAKKRVSRAAVIREAIDFYLVERREDKAAA